jgi:hypothetical protein
MDPSPAWNRKLILARGGESLLAGTWTTSSSTTVNFIGADLLPPSPQACSIAAVQANRIAVATRSKYKFRLDGVKATSSSSCSPGFPPDSD